MIWLRRILGIGVPLALIWSAWKLAVANSTPVTVNYIFGEISDVEHWRVLLVAFVCGGACVGLALLYQSFKAWLMRRHYRKRVTELESEVHQLRNLPLMAPETSGPDSIEDVGGATVRDT